MRQGEPSSRSQTTSLVLNIAPALAYVAAVFYLGSIPAPPLPELPQVGSDKVGHFLAFFGLVVPFIRAGRYAWPALSDPTLRVASCLAASVVGGLLEVYQMAVPGRSAELGDWLADCVGAVLAALVIRPGWVSTLDRQERSV